MAEGVDPNFSQAGRPKPVQSANSSLAQACSSNPALSAKTSLAKAVSSSPSLAASTSLVKAGSSNPTIGASSSLAQAVSSNLTVASIHTIGSANVTPRLQKKFTSRESSITTGTDLLPICRICQMPGDAQDPLFTPCRCSGTLGFIHFSCLKRWIEISTRKTKKQPRCELCHYQFHRHKRFKFKNWRFPRVNNRDKCLHIIFLLNLVVMIGCAVATILCFLSDKGQITKFPKNKVELTTEEIITLGCGVAFFVAFFIAMTVEIKAKHTVYKLCMRFIMHNTEWAVDAYDRNKDPEMNRPLRAQYV